MQPTQKAARLISGVMLFVNIWGSRMVRKKKGDWPGPRKHGGINWDNFENDINGIIESAASQTDKKLTSKLSSLTKLTDKEILNLFPDPSDIKKLSELIRIVKSSDDINTKINQLVDGIEKFGRIIIVLLSRSI